VLGCKKLIGIVREVNRTRSASTSTWASGAMHVIEDADPEGALIIYSLKREDCKFLERNHG
jgi:hypothetical protein